MQLKRLLVIPARSGSKRIKNKNFKLFNGKPIIHFSIVTALKSKIFDTIVVSTDNRKYLNFLKKYKINILIRSKKISNDSASIEAVLRNTILEYEKKGKKFDEVWCLAPCSPLIKKEDLLKAANLLKKNSNKIVLPVTEYPAPLEWGFRFGLKKKLIPIKKNYYKIRSQDLPKSFYDTGNFVAIPSSYFKKKTIEFDRHYIGIEIPRDRSIDIDDLIDWKLAEYLYEKKK